MPKAAGTTLEFADGLAAAADEVSVTRIDPSVLRQG
jgi:hypothetical protein